MLKALPVQRDWRVLDCWDADASADAGEMPATDLLKCQQHCEKRGLGGFVVFDEMAYFKKGSAQTLLRKRVFSLSCTFHLGFMPPVSGSVEKELQGAAALDLREEDVPNIVHCSIAANDQGTALLDAGNTAQAVEVFAQGVGCMQKVLAMDLSRMKDESLKDYLHLNFILCMNLAGACEKVGDFSSAIDNANGALEICPTHPEALRLRATAAMQLGTEAWLERACADFKLLLKNDPSDISVKRQLQHVEKQLREVKQKEFLALAEATGKDTTESTDKLVKPIEKPLENSQPQLPQNELKEPKANFRAVSDESVIAWRKAVQLLGSADAYLQCEAESDYAEDLAELKQLMEKCDDQPRFELVVEGDTPVLVTAPHTIPLRRDDNQPHLAEERTAEIARAISKELGASILTWTRPEQRRSNLLWSLAKPRDVNPGEILDPRNRDPNYLSEAELGKNLWFQAMQGVAKKWGAELGHRRATLHIDVHGCRDPPETPSHLTVGLGAICLHARRQGPEALAAIQAFKAALETELTSALSGLKLEPKARLVRVVLPFTKEDSYSKFAGAWPMDSGRLTQSQQAIMFAGFTQSVQLEMSKALRHKLSNLKKRIPRISTAILVASEKHWEQLSVM